TTAAYAMRERRQLLGTSAYSREGTWMKTGAPVDLQRRRIQAGAPRAHAIDGDVVCRGVIFGAHSTPVQCLDMHGPERLDGLVALVRRHRLARPFAPLACFFTGRFQQVQCGQPAVERAVVQPMEPTIFGASDTASTPRLQVSRHHARRALCSKYFVLIGDPPMREEPDIVRQCSSEQMCETRTLTPDRPMAR